MRKTEFREAVREYLTWHLLPGAVSISIALVLLNTSFWWAKVLSGTFFGFTAYVLRPDDPYTWLTRQPFWALGGYFIAAYLYLWGIRFPIDAPQRATLVYGSLGLFVVTALLQLRGWQRNRARRRAGEDAAPD